MKKLLRGIASFRLGPITFPIFLLAICLAAYAPLITRLGFYWDDFPMNWIASTMGGDGLARYFSTNRPVWGLVYRVTTALLGSRPLTWQLFALLMRWVTGLTFWMLLRLTWPENNKPSKTRGQFAAWAAVLLVIYPGFSQQFIAFLYSHFYIILTIFLVSLSLMVLAVNRSALGLDGRYRPRMFWLLTAVSLALSLFNMLAMEYFFLLDLLRPLLIWVVFSDLSTSVYIPNRIQRLKRTLLNWLPYLAVFIGAMFWRSVLFGFQTYKPALISRIKADPVQAILSLIPVVLRDVWQTTVGAWVKAFTIPPVLEIGARNLQRYWLFVAAGALIALVYLLLYQAKKTAPRMPAGDKANWVQRWQTELAWAWQPVTIGLLALFIAGGPFWLTDLQIGLVFSNDRFTLPFMIGASLVAAGLLTLLPLPRWSKVGLLGVALGFAIGLQFYNANVYARDWNVQRSLFWQMVWRMPDLKPGTTLLSNELPVIHYTDNSLSAPLNWIYDPQNSPLEMKYLLTYPTLRKEDLLKDFQKDTPFELNYLAATFHGNTSQMIALYFNPPGCLRVLDPEIDRYNWMVPLYLRESLALAATSPILPVPSAGKPKPRPPAMIYGSEIQHGWCYYFEKADLARQLGDWSTIAKLGDEGFSINDYPNDPLERFPFIEGYAHTVNWKRAVQLSRDSYAVSPQVMQPMLCKLWERINQGTPASNEKAQAIQTVHQDLGCTQPVSQIP